MTSIYDVRIPEEGSVLNAIDLVVKTTFKSPDGFNGFAAVTVHHEFSDELKELIRQICREEIAKALKDLKNE
jgi:hypothetical protein